MGQYLLHVLVEVRTTDAWSLDVLGWAWDMFLPGWSVHAVVPEDEVQAVGDCSALPVGRLVWSGASPLEGHRVGVQHSLSASVRLGPWR